MITRAVLAVLLVGPAACVFDPSGVTADDDGAAPDASRLDGADDDGARGCTTWAALNVEPCAAELPGAGSITLGSGRTEYDTDTGVLTAPGSVISVPPSAVIPQSGGPDVRVLDLAGLDVPVGSALVVVGDLGLIIVVHGSASVSGTIDVSARREGSGEVFAGPGGDDAVACVGMGGEGGGPPSNLTSGGGGGGGGGFGDDGGDGSDGNGGGHGTKGTKGTKNADDLLVPLRGGCGGGSGGDDGDATIDAGGLGGPGGGALEITALGNVGVSGTIRASGGGGGGGSLAKAGGGGGGAGGAILLDGEVVALTASAALCANGGGGGEGGQVAQLAVTGQSGNCTGDTRATGGALGGDGGDGGDGGALVGTGGTGASGASSGGGGGGGGGGVGRIHVRGRSNVSIDGSAVVSPAPAP